MPEPIFYLRDLYKAYGDHVVLHLPSLEIHSGEIVSFVGPSGAGKSTLLRLLNFLEPPTAGDLLYCDIPYQTLNLAQRREITTVFQRPILLNTTVRANVEYGLNLRGLSEPAAVDEMLTLVGLQSLSRAPARKLSGGEMQRVALARALVVRPRVLLLDEPTANLDPHNVSLIEDILRTQHQTHNTTIILVTHNLFQAKRLATRTGLLLNGSLIELSPTPAFFENPTDPRTAAFTRGEMIY